MYVRTELQISFYPVHEIKHQVVLLSAEPVSI